MICARHVASFLMSFFDQGCFSATTRASEEPSNRGINDLANQIYHAPEYKRACQSANEPAGKYLSVEAGEWFSGLPLGWTSLKQGIIKHSVFDSMFPDAKLQAGHNSVRTYAQ